MLMVELAAESAQEGLAVQQVSDGNDDAEKAEEGRERNAEGIEAVGEAQKDRPGNAIHSIQEGRSEDDQGTGGTIRAAAHGTRTAQQTFAQDKGGRFAGMPGVSQRARDGTSFLDGMPSNRETKKGAAIRAGEGLEVAGSIAIASESGETAA